jgi:putative endonuclease
MPFDLLPDPPAQSAARAHRGRLNYQAGLAAEAAVARRYEAAGWRVLDRRWRGRAGEVDLIMTGAEGLLFIEVKSARTHREAWESLDRAQFDRIVATADEYAADFLGTPFADRRLDLALCDRQGRIDVLEHFVFD